MDAHSTSEQSAPYLWEAFKTGDKQAFSLLYKQYFNVLYDYGIRHTGEEEITIDCIQDFFLYLWNHRENLGELRSVRFYLLTSFRRRLFKCLAKERKTSYLSDSFAFFQPDKNPTADRKMILAEEEAIRTEIIRHILDDLSPRQKEVLYLRYFNGFTPKEISEIMGINYQTVVNHLCEAFKSLRNNKMPMIKDRLG